MEAVASDNWEQASLEFVPHGPEQYFAAVERLYGQGARRFRFLPANELARETAQLAAKKLADAEIAVSPAAPDGFQSNDVLVACEPDGDRLAETLMLAVDRPCRIVAPVTARHFRNLPLFLISIPKSGTHLLHRLIHLFGYVPGIRAAAEYHGGHWYCLEYDHSHTSARNFFVDSVRRSPFGMRDHPFMRSPAVFIYRNPLDTVVSEANYYHQDGKTPFAGYLSGLDFEARLLRLIDDPWLLGRITDRVGDFAAWLDFPNVVPISFEELVGPQGGGSAAEQARLIWSLQLKLQVPGRPAEIGAAVFDASSPTFHAGQIGSHRWHFTRQAHERFYALPQEVMEVFGYAGGSEEEPAAPSRAGEFRQRGLRYSRVDFSDTPIAVEYDYLRHNIVKYRGRYYGISQASGVVNVRQAVADGTRFPHGKTLDEVRRRIDEECLAPAHSESERPAPECLCREDVHLHECADAVKTAAD